MPFETMLSMMELHFSRVWRCCAHTFAPWHFVQRRFVTSLPGPSGSSTSTFFFTSGTACIAKAKASGGSSTEKKRFGTADEVLASTGVIPCGAIDNMHIPKTPHARTRTRSIMSALLKPFIAQRTQVPTKFQLPSAKAVTLSSVIGSLRKVPPAEAMTTYCFPSAA